MLDLGFGPYLTVIGRTVIKIVFEKRDRDFLDHQ